MLKNYKVDQSHKEQEELVLLKSTGSYNTWRVFFNIHEDEEARTEEEREWVEYEVVTRAEKDEEGNVIFFEDQVEIPKKEVVVTKTFLSNYVDFTKHKDEDISAIGLIKEMILGEIDAYDTSSEVNSFYLEGMPVWLSKDIRVGLMNSTSIEKAAGHEETTLWLGTTPLVINCDLAINLLGALELYALECFNKTAEHKRNIENIETIEELIEYDYTEGYPEKLNLSLA